MNMPVCTCKTEHHQSKIQNKQSFLFQKKNFKIKKGFQMTTKTNTADNMNTKMCMRRVYRTPRGEKNPGVLSFEAIKRVRPAGTHFAILRRINSALVSLSR